MHVKSRVLSQQDIAASEHASSTDSEGQGLELVSGGHGLPVRVPDAHLQAQQSLS